MKNHCCKWETGAFASDKHVRDSSSQLRKFTVPANEESKRDKSLQNDRFYDSVAQLIN